MVDISTDSWGIIMDYKKEMDALMIVKLKKEKRTLIKRLIDLKRQINAIEFDVEKEKDKYRKIIRNLFDLIKKTNATLENTSCNYHINMIDREGYQLERVHKKKATLQAVYDATKIEYRLVIESLIKF